MKVRLLQDIPVDPAHGLTEGRVLEALHPCGSQAVWVMGDDDNEVRLHSREYEFVKPGDD